MDAAWAVYLVCFFIAVVVAGSVTLAFLGRFSRRCTELEWAVGDLQKRASTFKGRDLAKARWDKDAAFQAEMAQVLSTAPPPTRRKYDNDPLGE